MVVARILFLIFFLLLALGLLVWQGWALLDFAQPLGLSESANGWTLFAISIVLGLGQGYALTRFELGKAMRWLTTLGVYGGTATVLWLEVSERVLNSGGWGFLFPLDLILLFLGLAASMPLILGRGDDLKAIAEKAGVAIVLVAINIGLPMALGRVFFPPELANSAGIATVVLLFFLFVDYYLIRALIHYFTSGATTFVSMRYLRKRPVSLASIMAIACGIMVLIVVNSIMNGFTSEYRTQVRGTMSDVLAYVEPELFYPSQREIDRELWAYSFARIKNNPDLLAQWDHALALAQQNLQQEGTAFYSPEEGEAPTFPKTKTPNPDQLSPELLRLNSPAGYGLADYLPMHPSLGLATPTAIYFSANYGIQAAREEAIQRVRSKLATKLFVPRMRAGMEVLDDVAKANDATEANAPRVENFAILKTGRDNEEFQKAQVTGIDPVQDLKVSSIGHFVRDGFYDSTRQSKVIEPLLNLFNGILLFEQASPAMIEKRLAPVYYEAGKLFSNHGSWVNYVNERALLASNGALRWPAVDATQFRTSTIGKAAYKLWRKAVKKVISTKDPDALLTIVTALEDDLLTLIDQHLGEANNIELFSQVPPEWLNTSERFGMLSRHTAPSPVKSERSVLAYFRYWYVYGVWRDHAALINRLKRVDMRINTALLNRPDSPNPPPAIKELAKSIGTRIQGFIREELPTLLDPKKFEVAKTQLYAELGAIRDDWYEVEGNEDVLADHNQDAFQVLNEIEPAMIRLMGYERNPSLRDLLASWDDRWREAKRRARAYQEVLPLRAYLLPIEAVDEYLIRARGRLPFRADGELWIDSQEDFKRAQATAIEMVMNGFVQHRITRSADDALPLSQEIAEREEAFFDAILAECNATKGLLEATKYSNTATGDGVARLESHLNALRGKVAELTSNRREVLREAGASFEPELRELFDVIDYDGEYWRLRPLVPGLILGSGLADQMRAEIGSTVQSPIIRITKGDPFAANSGNQIQAAEEEFRVNAVFKSGLHASNVGTFFGDYQTWMGLFGASKATYVQSIKLKGYDASMSVPRGVVEDYRAILSEKREALPKLQFGESPWSSELNLEQAATISGWGWSPQDRHARQYDMTTFTTWESKNAALLSAVEREKKMLTILLGLIVVLAGVVILIVVYLTVVEKVKDIGILKAMGASPWGVRSIFMFNALYIGVFGTIIGAGLAIIISENLNQIEDWIEASFGVRLFPPDIYYLAYIPSVKGEALFQLALKMSVPTTLWAFFCGIGPAMVASRKDTVEALQHE